MNIRRREFIKTAGGIALATVAQSFPAWPLQGPAGSETPIRVAVLYDPTFPSGGITVDQPLLQESLKGLTAEFLGADALENRLRLSGFDLLINPYGSCFPKAARAAGMTYNQLINRVLDHALVRDSGLGAHGTRYAVDDFYDQMLITHPTVAFDGRAYPSLEKAADVCDTILHLATVTNGELAYRSYKNMEEKVGLPLAHLAEKARSVRVDYKGLQSRPHRFVNSPMWSGLIDEGRPYSPFTYNVECQVPWRTLTGRQHFYLDHPGYLDFGEHLPTYKPKPQPKPPSPKRASESPREDKRLVWAAPEIGTELAAPFVVLWSLCSIKRLGHSSSSHRAPHHRTRW